MGGTGRKVNTSLGSDVLKIKPFALAALIAVQASTAQAITFSSMSGIFDDTNDLLSVSGTIDAVLPGYVPFDGLFFDWDVSPQLTSVLLGGSLLSSNLGGSYSTYGAGISAIAVTGISGGSTSGPLAFDFLFSLPGADARFLGLVDVGVKTGLLYGDQAQDVFLVTAGDLSASPVPLPASLPLLGAGLAALFGLRLRRKRA